MAQFNGKKPENLKETLGRLLYYFGKHKKMLLVVVVLVVISALTSVIGTYLLKPIINDYIVPGDLQGLLKMAIFMGLLYLTGVFATLGYTQVMVSLAQSVVKEIREDLFSHVQELPLSFFDGQTHGELMSSFTNDIDVVSDALNNSFTTLIQSIVLIIGTVTTIMLLNWHMSIVVLICYFGMYVFIQYSSKKSKFYFSKQQKHLSEVNGFIEEMMDGQKVVKVFNHEKQNQIEFNRRNEELRVASTEALTYSGIMIPVVVSVSYINYAIVACIGGFLVIAGPMSIGSLSSYLVFVRQTALPINQFTQQSNFVLAALSGAERIFHIMDLIPEVDKGLVTLTNAEEKDGNLIECEDSTGIWAWRHPHKDGSISLVRLQGDVRFEDVIFSYTYGHPILKNISLYARPGEKIAFVGSTGAGKTTITNLINRFYEIQSGTITYDGIDIRLIKKDDLRRSLSVVLQDTHLFTGTIADNIRYGKLHATMDEVEAAAKLANADSFIRKLPKGYHTMLTSDGANLSQGQRQLLSIARAAISRPPVLILDEATSSIDTRTESLIEKGMDRLMEHRTVFVIAHRLSTVRNADAIIVLDHGVIIERGNHEELLAQKGRYYQLYTGQFELE